MRVTVNEREYHERMGRILLHRQVWEDVIADLNKRAATTVARPPSPAAHLYAYLDDILAEATRPIPKDSLGTHQHVRQGLEKERERMKQVIAGCSPDP